MWTLLYRTSAGLKFAVRGTLTSGNKCLCLSAGMGAVMRTSLSGLSGSRRADRFTLECGATGAATKKNGLFNSTASSRKSYVFWASTSVE